jgi:hypothetical protein
MFPPLFVAKIANKVQDERLSPNRTQQKFNDGKKALNRAVLSRVRSSGSIRAEHTPAPAQGVRCAEGQFNAPQKYRSQT